MADVFEDGERELASLFSALERAKAARSKWAAEEAELKDLIFEALGYADDDPKPQPLNVVDPRTGDVTFAVKVGTWRGLDVKYLKERHPHIYAECERTKATKSIKG